MGRGVPPKVGLAFLFKERPASAEALRAGRLKSPLSLPGQGLCIFHISIQEWGKEMKKRNLLIIGCLILGLGIFFYLSKENLSQTSSIFSASSAEEKENKGVDIPPEKQQLMGVKKSEASMISLEKIIRTVGRIEYDERKLATVNIKVEGWIEKLYADYSGKYVRKGERLADIYSPELVATQLELINLLQWRTEKAHRFQRNVEFTWGDRYGTTGRLLTFDIEAVLQVARQKLELWELSEEQIKQVEEKKEPMRSLTIYSPINGYITQKAVVEGTRVLPGDRIFDIADLSALWVIADIYVYELPMIKVGQPAKITLSHFPGKEFSSKIDYIYPTLSGETRTAKVRFSLPNPGGQLKPQMFADVELKLDLGKKLAIPEDAVIDTGTKKVVYVDREEGFFEPREVVLGLTGEGIVEVVKGLKEGEKVASAANFLIDSEAKLKGVVQ
jgi:Cu(I)/Ag(I) efflux system membrane fusion protein